MRIASACVVLALMLASCGGGDPTSAPAQSAPAATSAPATSSRVAARGMQDWPMFGRTPAKPSSSDASTGITAAQAPKLRRTQVPLPGTVDSSPIFLHAVRAAGRSRDVFMMTTTYGRTVAVDARTGRMLWTFTPRGIERWAGSAQITTASPAAATDRRHVFAPSPDGGVHRLRVSDGREDPGSGGRWPVSLTKDATHEKLTSPLTVAGGRLIVVTGGYIGDAPPYQGHVVTLDERTGAIGGVFNSLCSERHAIQDPTTCPESASAIWGRAGAVVEPASGRLLVTTGNARADGRRFWGDSTLELSPTANRLLQSWTPTNADELEQTDADLGSASPALLPGGVVLQSGKEGEIDVLDLAHLNGRGGANATRGGELQVLDNPGRSAMIAAAIGVWTHAGTTLAFAATDAGTTAFKLIGRRLKVAWSDRRAGTSPVVAGGLLWVYDPSGALVVRRPQTGRVIARLPAGAGHWNSPVPGAGAIALPQGNSNEHADRGVLNLYRAG